MLDLTQITNAYLEHCRYQKTLDAKTIKAYSIDLKQFFAFMATTDGNLSKSNVSAYIMQLHKDYAPRSAKRKIATLKAFFSYLEYEELLEANPFSRLRIKFREPKLLPRSIPLDSIRKILAAVHQSIDTALTNTQKRIAMRDAAVLELLFATGVRVSELCLLTSHDIDLQEGIVRIYGKGSKERIVQIENAEVLETVQAFSSLVENSQTDYFFMNRLNNRLSEQSVRSIVNKYVRIAGLPVHVTPHMFRHSFAALLHDEDVDIRYIQRLLGHSSILTTQIYTHVTNSKQREILAVRHPRNKINIGS